MAIGGICAGIFTPTEGGAVGGVSVLLIAYSMLRLDMRTMYSALAEAGKPISMILF